MQWVAVKVQKAVKTSNTKPLYLQRLKTVINTKAQQKPMHSKPPHSKSLVVPSEVQISGEKTKTTMPSHPYYPTSLSLPHYVGPTRSMLHIVGGFFAVCGAAFAALLIASGRIKHMSRMDRAVFCW